MPKVFLAICVLPDGAPGWWFGVIPMRV